MVLRFLGTFRHLPRFCNTGLQTLRYGFSRSISRGAIESACCRILLKVEGSSLTSCALAPNARYFFQSSLVVISLSGFSIGLLHQCFRRPNVVHIDDVVAALHRIGPMPRDAHPHHLRHARAPHVADCRAPQVMELEIGNRRRFAGVLSRFAEIPDRAAVPHEDWLEVLAGNTVG